MKLLYISCNPKPEEQSVCKTTARRFIDKCLDAKPNLCVEEMDLYNENIPEVSFDVFTHRATVKHPSPYEEIPPESQQKIDRLNFLCEQFLSADRYVIAAPMWSLMFPGRLKNYLDCIIQNHKVIEINDKCVKGLLDDIDRRMLYVQSSGGNYTGFITSRFDYGTDYLQMMFKFLGIKTFKSLPVEGTGTANQSVAKAIIRAEEEMQILIKDFLLE